MMRKTSFQFLLCEFGRQAINLTHLLTLPVVFKWINQYGLIITGITSLCKKEYLSKQFIFIYFWLLWVAACCIRGVFAIEIYWDAKNLINTVPILFLPIFGIIFSSPKDTLSFLKKWNYLFLIHGGLILCGLINARTTHFSMGVAYSLYATLFVLIPNKKWKILILVLLLVMLSDMDARSQVIKSAVAICVMTGLIIDCWVIRFFAKIVSLTFYPLAITLLYLGITGQFNIFDFEDHSFDEIVTYSNGNFIKQKSSSSDSRTFLYIDIISSAYQNEYIVFGRTPARGNDAFGFYKHMGTSSLEPDMRLERYQNEFCHPTLFTWLGLIGVLLYAFIFIQATILALFFSNNSYSIYLASIVSFNWFYGWIENAFEIDMLNIGIWIIIGICISPQFRKMNNDQFKIWFQSLFSSQNITPYVKYNLIRNFIILKVFANRKK